MNARRIISVAVWALAAGATAAGAQTPEPATIELDWLRTPTSPAFTLLDVNPATVARPATPRALATELVSSTSRGTVIPNNYALEFAPYWLTPKPALTYQQYLQPGRGQSLRQSFSVSLGTARGDSGAGSSPTRVALGFRALPSSGRVSARFRTLAEAFNQIRRRRLVNVDRFTEMSPGRAADSLRAIIDAQADSMRAMADQMGAEERVGFFWEVAAAVAAAFPEEDFDAGKVSRYGVWTTVTYRADAPRLDFLALARFLRSTGADGQNGIDLGGRLHWEVGDLGLSSEWVSRTAFDVVTTTPAPGTGQVVLTLTSSSRVVGIVDYRAADDLYVTMSFGQDYRELGADRRPLVARLGLQFSFGDTPLVLTPPRS